MYDEPAGDMPMPPEEEKKQNVVEEEKVEDLPVP